MDADADAHTLLALRLLTAIDASAAAPASPAFRRFPAVDAERSTATRFVSRKLFILHTVGSTLVYLDFLTFSSLNLFGWERYMLSKADSSDAVIFLGIPSLAIRFCGSVSEVQRIEITILQLVRLLALCWHSQREGPGFRANHIMSRGGRAVRRS